MARKVSTSKNEGKKMEMTLLDAIEHVVEVTRDCKLEAKVLKKVAPELKLLSCRYGITEQQAILFCISMERGPRRVDYDDLASHLDISKIGILRYSSDVDALVRRRLLRYRDVKDEDSFDVPTAVIRCLKHNEVYELPKRTGLDCAEMFELLDLWFEDLDDDAISAVEMQEELSALFDENPQIGFARQVEALNLPHEDQLLLTLFCHFLINRDDDDIRFGQMEDVFSSSSNFCNAKSRLRSGKHVLQKLRLIEYCCEDGIANNTRYKLTEDAKRTLLGELKLNTAEEKLADFLYVDQLTEKQLFFTSGIQQQIDDLNSFLSPNNYLQIQNRMKEKGFRSGFACLFYGSPGTGKTETVYQLAKRTGRSIMIVDVPQIKSKWVGDSEKNIKALFDRYREQVKRAKLTPILLFNEADAIIGIRKNGAQSAVDKMENSIQNIILQEMETLDGIMIATTNLQQNLDQAFERRFLYKIKFEKPSLETRTHIWHTMIPDLADADVQMLAKKYDFSGGQIENIARHYNIDMILHGEKENMLSTLMSHCDNERLSQKNERKVGF